MKDDTFMLTSEHFSKLVEQLDPREQKLYETLQNVRQETVYRGRHFIIYEMRGGRPVELDRIYIKDFECTDAIGATTEIENSEGDTLPVGYAPTQVFQYPIMVWLPLHVNLRLRWAATAGNIGAGSLAYEMAVRTQSRSPGRPLSQPGVTYMETGTTFGREFNGRQR